MPQHYDTSRHGLLNLTLKTWCLAIRLDDILRGVILNLFLCSSTVHSASTGNAEVSIFSFPHLERLGAWFLPRFEGLVGSRQDFGHDVNLSTQKLIGCYTKYNRRKKSVLKGFT